MYIFKYTNIYESFLISTKQYKIMKRFVPILFLLFCCACIEQKTELPQDVLSIESLGFIPETPIAGSSFTLTLKLTNLDNEKILESVKVYVHDSGLCESIVWGENIGEIYPNANEIVELPFKAPTNEQIGSTENKCIIKLRITYDFNATTMSELYVIDIFKLEELQKAGKPISVTPAQEIGRGPIKIKTEIKGEQPILEETKAAIIFQAENNGDGLFETIPGEELSIASSQLMIDCPEKEIVKVKGKILPIVCELTTPDVDDIKKFYITAELPYRYEIYEDYEVRIKPKR